MLININYIYVVNSKILNDMKKSIFSALCLVLLATTTQNAWGESYSTGTIPSSGWDKSGGNMTMSNIEWAYSSSTYIAQNNGNIQIGSKNNPQTSNWTIQTPISNFGQSIKITAISITAYTTATTATYDISVNGSSVKSGSLTTSSKTYSVSNLSITSGDIVITLKGSNNSKAMYLSSITVTYETGSTGTTVYLGLFLAAFVAVRACVRRVECLYATFHHIIMSKIDFRSVHFAKECFVCFLFLVLCCFCR